MWCNSYAYTYRKNSLLGPPSSSASSPEKTTFSGLSNEKLAFLKASMADFRTALRFITIVSDSPLCSVNGFSISFRDLLSFVLFTNNINTSHSSVRMENHHKILLHCGMGIYLTETNKKPSYRRKAARRTLFIYLLNVECCRSSLQICGSTQLPIFW